MDKVWGRKRPILAGPSPPPCCPTYTARSVGARLRATGFREVRWTALPPQSYRFHGGFASSAVAREARSYRQGRYNGGIPRLTGAPPCPPP
ncbi:hypothetical protein GCM10009552_23450 [Rothia nasimurium]